jgi:uncharacterized protein
MIVAVRVERVTLDTSNNRFVVILKDDIYKRWLPIVVGLAEAQAIALQLKSVHPPRPMTHDLMKNLIESLKGNVARVIVSELKENTYYAVIDVKMNGNQNKIDARPSDAIALALRTSSPIFVEEDVMVKASISEDLLKQEPVDEADELQNLNRELMKAVEEERYEDAARIRDEINTYQQQNKKEK